MCEYDPHGPADLCQLGPCARSGDGWFGGGDGAQSLRGGQLLCNSLNSFASDEASLHIPVRAAENKVFVAAANKVGPLVPPEMVVPISEATGIPVKFLDGAGVLEAYPDCEICHTSLTEMTDNFANKMMGIFDRNDELDKDGLIQAAFAMGIIPDLLRHCHGTAAHIVNAIDSFFRSFIDFEEFMGLLTENGTIVLAEVVMEARAIPDKSDDF